MERKRKSFGACSVSVALIALAVLSMHPSSTANYDAAATRSGQEPGGRDTPTPPTPTPRPTPRRQKGGKSGSVVSTPPRRPPPCVAKSPTLGTGNWRNVDLGGGVKLEMVQIPAGSFCMGSTDGYQDEKPMHRVTIGRQFYMGIYEVKQAQWQALMGNNPAIHKGDDLPVENVSWEDAQKFIGKLNDLRDGYIYRLPSEAEWEYAARAGTTGDYAGALDALACYSKQGEFRGPREWPCPVGSRKRANGFGLYDMHGNVWEWCEDWYHDNYRGAPTDGSAWLSPGTRPYRITRGGSYSSHEYSCRSASRGMGTFAGFRVVAVGGIRE